MTFREQCVARILPGASSSRRARLDGQVLHFDRIVAWPVSGASAAGFDEQYCVDVRQLCDKFNRKTQSNIGYKIC